MKLFSCRCLLPVYYTLLVVKPYVTYGATIVSSIQPGSFCEPEVYCYAHALTVQGRGSSIILPQGLPTVLMNGRARVVSSMERLGGHSHNETCVGCIVSSTTAISFVPNWFKSTSSRTVALNVASVRASSYLRR